LNRCMAYVPEARTILKSHEEAPDGQGVASCEF
jgi:hypothetical protein